MKCYVFDIDGTLADLTHRLHLIQQEKPDWDAFYDACEDDRPIAHMLDLCWELSITRNVVFVSGRSERCRERTLSWLSDHLGRQPKVLGPLYMRADGDPRPDYKVKLDLLAKLRADGYEPIMAFEDRDQVVKMYREAGIPCAQVAEGAF
jgi:hypothetical protein